MKQLHFLRIAISALFLPFLANGQDFLNGSFEQNGNLCLLNASSTVFNANVKNTRSFGSFRKPDIMSSDCGYGSAKDGRWFVGLATNVQGGVRNEAITLQLTSEIQEGSQYSLSFWVRSRSSASNLELGVSTNDSTSGKVFYTVSANSIGGDWTEVSIRFTAPVTGKYVSVRAVNPNMNSGVWIDAFRLGAVFQADNVVVASPAHNEPKAAVNNHTGKTSASPAVAIYPNPSEGVFRLSNTDSTALLSLTVYNMLGATVEQHVATADEPVPTQIDLTEQLPGLYFVELATVNGEKTTKRIVVSR